MIDKLLDFVRKTNPEMTKEKLIFELHQSKYSSIAICMVVQSKNSKFKNIN